MSTEQQPIDALNKAILAKDELIKFLNQEIDRLKAAQFIFPQSGQSQPTPNTQPFIPGQPGQASPYGPLTPPYIVTGGDPLVGVTVAYYE